MEDLRTDVMDAGRQAGLDRVGVTTAAPFPQTRQAMDAQIESGRSGRLGFTFKDPATATDVTRTFPWAKRLVVGVSSYLPESGTAPSRPGHGRVARFAVDDPYAPLRRGLEAMAEVLATAGHSTAVLADDSRLVDRAAAVRAGVAWWGKSTMALTPGLGPWFVIGSVVTDAALTVDVPMVRSCGTCTACLPACPTGALVADGVIDTRRCLAALAQAPGVIPRQWRTAMGDRLYGCDDCLDACPPGGRLAAAAAASRGSVSLEWLLQAGDDAVMDRFSHFYVPRRSARYLRRNALVAMGNDGSPGLMPIVTDHVAHRDWLLRAHAVWALGRLAGPEARPLLTARLEHEERPEVRDELEWELGI